MRSPSTQSFGGQKREFFIDNLLVRIHSTIVMIGWTGLAPWEFEFPFRRTLLAHSAQTLHTLSALPRRG